MTFAVFWRVAPLQNTAAGTQGANSRTPRKDQSSLGKETTGAHTSRERGTVRIQCTHQQFTTYQQCLIPYPWHVGSPNSRLTTMLFPQLAENNCRPMVLQVVQGYRLELMSTPNQQTAPRPLDMKNSHLLGREIQK